MRLKHNSAKPRSVSSSSWPRLAMIFLGIMLLTACRGLRFSGEPPPTPRPTVIVVTTSGPYAMNFDEAGDWLVGGGDTSGGWVENGQYHLAIEKSDTLVWTHQPRAFGDATYEVDATLVSGPEASAFGLLLLGASDLRSFFYCMITADGRFDIGYCEDNCQTQQSLVGGFTLAYAIQSGTDVRNHLAVRLSHGTLTLLVNGAPISQVDGLEYSEGLVGFIGESAHYGGFEAAFDNLYITEP